MDLSKYTIWSTFELQLMFAEFTEEDYIQADLQGITIEQYLFNNWLEAIYYSQYLHKINAKNYKLENPIKLSRMRCWFWPLFLKIDKFGMWNWCNGWKIGHCLNCDADPYDGYIEAWRISAIDEGALIRCGKCKQLRWQSCKMNNVML